MQLPLTIIEAGDAARSPRGKYVVDFGDQKAIGITGAEVAEILESERHAEAKVYKIHRVYPDGRMELAGVQHRRFRVEDGLLFRRTDAATARADFEVLRAAAADRPPPCRVRIHLGRNSDELHPHIVALRYPAEYGDEISAWLLGIAFQGGDVAEAGMDDGGMQVVDRIQL